ncbi:MAG TPA: GGDEF domain-containing response regulator [Methylotenera sp.]|nr:GGDEF domain-containing response regulator [Methylotenera sp.]
MKPLRALIVEDSADDAELLLNELKHADYNVFSIRVDTAAGMSEALAKQTWDIIFSDFTMPQFNAFDALSVLHHTTLDIPFIIVSGTIGEDRAVNIMKAGAHDYVLKGNLKRLVPATQRELREAEIRQERRQAEEIIYSFAYTDQVTQLPNRARFHELVRETVSHAQSGKWPMALLLMDLDRFKDVNDTLGHDSGDILLKEVGKRLTDALFDADIVARLGGDEFGVLLTHLASINDLPNVIKKLQGAFASPFMIDAVPIEVEVSIGVATMPEHADNADKLLQLADIAMYRAKQMASGYAIYEPRYNLHSMERLGLMAELRDGIEQNQLLLHYQPKLDLKTGHIFGLEALVRWQHPRLGLLYPDKFIGIAEPTGLINPLTRWVLCEALRYCQELALKGNKMCMCVNLSARSLHDPQLLKMVDDAFKITGTEPSQLILEITESAIFIEPTRAKEAIIALSERGIGLSIDDFGTGFTSLASIKNLPITEIKIDRSFIMDMLINKKDAMIVRSVIELGHNLGITVVAEGVETKEILQALAELGCDVIQGYYISKPLPTDTLKAWLPNFSYTL